MKHILLAATALALLPVAAAVAEPTLVPAIDTTDHLGSGNGTKPVIRTASAEQPTNGGPVVLTPKPPGATATDGGSTPPASVVQAPPAAAAPASAPVTPVASTLAAPPAITPPPQFAQEDGPGNNAATPQYPNHPPPALDPINRAPVPLSNKEHRAVAISRAWRSRTAMPATGADGAVVFTYGATQPSIVCAPLTVCLLKLEEGEHVLPDGLQLGDKARWHVTPTLSGNQTVLVIKPTDSALRTVMAVMTDRRVYSIRLVSVDAESRSMALAEFDYPDETPAQWQSYYQQVEQKRQDNTLPNGRNIANLDFNYRISGDSPSWRPERVYSDGIHTYIQFPDAMRSSDSPSLLALAHDGSWFSNPTGQLVNYRRQGNTYLVDRVLDRAELVVGVGDDQTRVVISHMGG